MTGPRRHAGFTLIELAVAVAVLVLLIGILVPLVSGVVEDTRLARARDDMAAIRAAYLRFQADTGYWPGADGGTGDESPTGVILGWAFHRQEIAQGIGYSPPEDPVHFVVVLDGEGALFRPGLSGHTLGARSRLSGAAEIPGWRGPYFTVTGANFREAGLVDPWGGYYVVIVSNLGVGQMVVACAGPNRAWNTAAADSARLDFEGDDLGLVLAEQL
ncbi:MAG: prepilin-type N-terminal cleavage/methylation domain-containing protein [Planctomycetes bacterium]|nr:prepilin-type N-terminal cleavage/methylation domain-containing protein [Planctomycetota bacterium]